MRAVYIGRYFMPDKRNVTFSSISMPILERKRLKQKLKDITIKEISFDDVTYETVQEAYESMKLYLKEPEVLSNILNVTNYRRKEYCRIIFHIALFEYEIHQEPLRIYIPFDKDKTFLRSLNKMAIKYNKEIHFEEIRNNESNFSQLASLIAGCVYYHNDEDLYLNNIGKTSQAQLTAYLYSSKKIKNKLNINDYIRKFRDDNNSKK